MTWPFKILIKIILSYIPWLYPLLKKMRISQLGQMDQGSHARKLFDIHAHRTYAGPIAPGLTLLELGPGDSGAAALWGAAHGAAQTYLVDVGAYANPDPRLYQAMADAWRSEGLPTPDLSSCQNLADVMTACRGHYLTNGLASLKTIPSGTVDFSWSHSVLEHIRQHEFLATFQELKRMTKPGGLSSHLVDLQDHLDHSLNNLRFSRNIWEADWFARGAFYTNRLRARQMMDLMEQAGFKIIQQERGYWPTLPIPRHKLHPDFRDLPEEELRTRTCSFILQA